MLGITAAVGVVAADRDVALVIEGSVSGRTAPRSGLARGANAPNVMLPLRHPFDRNPARPPATDRPRRTRNARRRYAGSWRAPASRRHA